MQNNKGLTLVELLIALVITLVLFLALMQTALLSINTNTMNSLRDEAVRIAEMRANEARNSSFDDLESDAGDNCPDVFTVPPLSDNGVLIERNIRNISNFDFCTHMEVADIGDNKRVDITVGWLWKAVPYTHNISTIVRSQ
ncbi:MAG: type II secretion system protein [Nitrospirae bacterium]|nr:type II secretion system protein [Nitrospirota bacterium]